MNGHQRVSSSQLEGTDGLLANGGLIKRAFLKQALWNTEGIWTSTEMKMPRPSLGLGTSGAYAGTDECIIVGIM